MSSKKPNGKNNSFHHRGNKPSFAALALLVLLACLCMFACLLCVVCVVRSLLWLRLPHLPEHCPTVLKRACAFAMYLVRAVLLSAPQLLSGFPTPRASAGKINSQRWVTAGGRKRRRSSTA